MTDRTGDVETTDPTIGEPGSARLLALISGDILPTLARRQSASIQVPNSEALASKPSDNQSAECRRAGDEVIQQPFDRARPTDRAVPAVPHPLFQVPTAGRAIEVFPPVNTDGLAADDIQRLAQASLAQDGSAAASIVERWRSEGHPLRTIVLDGLGGAARTLGEGWVDDTNTFFEVTVGVSRLEALLAGLGERPDPAGATASEATGHDGKKKSAAPRIFFTPTPGEQHTFPTSLVGWLFRSHGWHVSRIAHTPDIGELVAAAADARPDVIGISLSSERFIPALRDTLANLRRARPLASIPILLGGFVIAEDPTIADDLGVDAIATSADGAVDVANRLADAKPRADGVAK
ncbi:MAG: cobalamin B12-binding domain-containing protein [Pseudomonadota bacterium]